MRVNCLENKISSGLIRWMMFCHVDLLKLSEYDELLLAGHQECMFSQLHSVNMYSNPGKPHTASSNKATSRNLFKSRRQCICSHTRCTVVNANTFSAEVAELTDVRFDVGVSADDSSGEVGGR